MKSSATIPFAIIVGGVILAAAVYISMPKQPDSSGGNPELVRPVSSSDHIFGNPAAKVVIVEYADFDCTYCSGFSETLHQIVANEGADGSIAWVYREFPLTEIHPNAMQHAKAAECVAQTAGNDAFWKFADMLYAHQPINPSQYGSFAQTLGIPGDAFASCYASDSPSINERIAADRENAFAVGGNGTPYSLVLVDGTPLAVMNGSYPYDAVKGIIENALGGAK